MDLDTTSVATIDPIGVRLPRPFDGSVWRRSQTASSTAQSTPSLPRTLLFIPVVAVAVTLGALWAYQHPAQTTSDIALLQHTASQGDSAAEQALGLAYQEGRGDLARDDTQTVYWLQRAAEHGETYAADQLGNLYTQGEGVAADPAAAAHWWQQAAAGGWSDAQRQLGEAYMNGQGVARDLVQARTWLGQAADAGDVQARSDLLALYRQGQADASDIAHGDGWLSRLAAATGSHTLAHLAAWTNGLPSRPTSVAELTRRAQQGDPAAEEALAWNYRTGAWGVTQDPALALQWFHRAAADGSRPAMESLAEIYQDGLLGVRPDPAQSRQWREQAQQHA